jgi:hypothetical protein
MIRLCVRLVLHGVSLRGVPRVLAVVAEALGWSLEIPHWTTGRLWLLRLGHAWLTAPLAPADDWAWLIDHSVQIGQEKCLVILGIRLGDLPPAGQCLKHADLHLIALVLRTSWTRQEVDDALEAATERTGVPRVIVSDHGPDVAGGVAFFQERHPQTVDVYDAKHKAACLLKSRLEHDPRWQPFQQRVAQTRCAIQQTALAFLVPPNPKPKARFMNLQATLAWAQKIVAIVQQPPAAVREVVSAERLQDKLGWVEEFAAAVAEWHEWQQVVNRLVEWVNRQGVSRGAAKALWKHLGPQVHASSRLLAQELLRFVVQQARQARPGERFPGSTEVLESCFGRFKHLEKQQARGGFTTLVLAFGALLAQTTTQALGEAMHHSRTKDIWQWCKDHLGTTLFGRRKLAFAGGATKSG